jgi:hypothetical protein
MEHKFKTAVALSEQVNDTMRELDKVGDATGEVQSIKLSNKVVIAIGLGNACVFALSRFFAEVHNDDMEQSYRVMNKTEEMLGMTEKKLGGTLCDKPKSFLDKASTVSEAAELTGNKIKGVLDSMGLDVANFPVLQRMLDGEVVDPDEIRAEMDNLFNGNETKH